MIDVSGVVLMGKDCDPWQSRNFNRASNAGAPATAKQIPNSVVLPSYAGPCGFFQLNSALMPPLQPSGFASGQSKFIVFDRTGDQTKVIYSSFGSQFSYPCPTTNDLPASNETNVSNGNVNVNEEMHEDTEEIDALLYSDSDNDFDEEEEASTGHYSPVENTTRNDEEEVASSAVLQPPHPPPAKRRRVESDLDDTASSTHCIGTNERKKAKSEKIQETVGILRRIVPGGKGKDAASVLDEAIWYLKSLRLKAKGLGLTALK